MMRRPPRITRTATLFPYTTLFRSRVLVAELRVVGGQVGTAVDLPGADRHAAVRAHVPGTREALPARQHRQPGADRVLRAAGHRVAVAALSHRDAAGRDRKSTRLNSSH